MTGLHIPHVEHTLPNGLKVFIHEDPRTPIVSVNLWYFVGSKDERMGRTGFAHLFEHLMFEGSKHVPKGQFDELLEDAGGTNNGSTTTDRTNYWETLPAGALDLALHLESDRMGWFLETITQQKLDGQRDVVKNERRQSYDNRPYGRAYETLMAALYPLPHPYHWPVIGWMEDLDAATLEDVQDFFRRYYAPNNAALAIAGDVRASEAIAQVEKYFRDIPAVMPPPAVVAATPVLERDHYSTLEDEVFLPRLYIGWHSPALFAEGDAELDLAAEILGAGKASRLYRELVHEQEIAQDVAAYQDGALLGSSLLIVVTAREGVSLTRIEAEVRRIVNELCANVTQRELERARNHIETATVDALQGVGGFGGKADRLNHYWFYTGNADGVAADLARYHAATPASVGEELRRVVSQPAAIVSVVPRGSSGLQAGGAA